ncbi:MAG: hypothetical protein QOE58_165, partial [Actinomycetota bacterium]|nr:hypothetical protein [Actinomycetota bacterium]
MYLLGVLFVAAGISVSIALHEVGHLLPAKRFGVKVTQYMVGFGPTIWSRRHGETEYGLKAIPLGGYIRMIGMFPPKPGADPSILRGSSTGRFSQLIDQARDESMEQVQPGEEDRVFYKLSTPRKVVVMLGGPTMNLVIAVVLLTGIFTLSGIGNQMTARVSAVSQCVQTVPANGKAPAACSPSDPKAPANVAGIKPGDRIISVNRQPVSDWDDVRTLVRPNGGKKVALLVDRDGKHLTLAATPILTDLPRIDAEGKPVVGADGRTLTERVGFMGFSPTVETVKQPLSAVPGLIGTQITGTASVVFRIPQKMVGVAQAAFGDGERDANGPMSVVGVGRVAGEVVDGQIPGLAGSGMSKFVILLTLIASLNLALFVFNLIPLLPLDGGHVAGALWVGLKR